MNESSQAIVAVKREVQLSERQRQVQERQEQGIPVDEWCASLGISKGAYYHRLRKVREYMCQQMVETHPNWECDLRSGNNPRPFLSNRAISHPPVNHSLQAAQYIFTANKSVTVHFIVL